LQVYTFSDFEGEINQYQLRQYFLFESTSETLEDFGSEVNFEILMHKLKNIMGEGGSREIKMNLEFTLYQSVLLRWASIILPSE
jgi:hypothetical protein